MNPEPDWGGEGEMAEEERHLAEVLHVMRSYERHGVQAVNHVLSTACLINLPSVKALYQARWEGVKAAMAQNQQFLDRILAPMTSIRSISPPPNKASVLYDNCQGLFKQLAREWSHDCRLERQKVHEPILAQLRLRVPISLRVLVPGAGLGRLAYEIGQAGYECEGTFLLW